MRGRAEWKYVAGSVGALCVLALWWWGAQWGGGEDAKTGDGGAKRIISMAPSATEILFEIGAGDRVVAVSSFTAWPEAAKRLPALGGHLDPSVEAIIALEPDLIVTNGQLPGVGRGGVPGSIRIEEVAFETYGDVERAILRLGEVTGERAKAERLLEGLRGEMEAVRAEVERVAKGERPRVLLVIGRDAGALRHVYGASGGSFLVYALGVAGGDDALGLDAYWPPISIEQVVQADPDIILELAPGQPGSVEDVRGVWRGALPALRAVRENRIYLLTDDALLIPGPRLYLAARRMAEVVHGEVFGGGR